MNANDENVMNKEKSTINLHQNCMFHVPCMHFDLSYCTIAHTRCNTSFFSALMPVTKGLCQQDVDRQLIIIQFESWNVCDYDVKTSF